MNDKAITTNDLHDFIVQAPKIELHAHLNGCIRESTLFELAQERSVTLSDYHFAAPSSSSIDNDDHSMYNVRPRSLQDCFDMFAEIPKCVDDLDSLRRITLEALEDFANHHVVYLELRSTPKKLRIKTGNDESKVVASKKQYCQVVLQAMKDFEELEQKRYAQETSSSSQGQARIPITCRFLVAIDRSASVEDAFEHVELARTLRQDDDETRVVGVDLGGNPTKVRFYHM